MRDPWDIYFLKIAKLVSTRATCHRASHGAVIVRDNNIISTGYNGAPAGHLDCIQLDYCDREEKKVEPGTKYELCKSNHAEMNAICQAARWGHSLLAATLYVTDVPCLICSKLIQAAGITEVIYIDTNRYIENNKTILYNNGICFKPIKIQFDF